MGRRQNDRLRAMYVGGHGNATAQRYARFWNMAFRLGLLPRRWVTLEVRGRRTGRATRFPVGMADVGGQWYVVSMLGECNWVRNVRAAGGQATLWRRQARPVLLVEVPVDERAPVIRRYVRRVPGGRPHIPVDWWEPVEAFETIASNFPVFKVTPSRPRPS
ncbi:MAG: nitroreductase/quinone reductase family protein [Dermatophilaceae bacterium]